VLLIKNKRKTKIREIHFDIRSSKIFVQSILLK